MNKEEAYSKLVALKEKCGSHSPSINTILENIEGIKCNIDACFLSNPYATELFLSRLENDLLIDKEKFRKYIEYYPQQNSFIAEKIAAYTGNCKENIVVANGAIEIIEKMMSLMSGKVYMTLPTFSSYYEFINKNTELVFDNGILSIDKILEIVKSKNCNNLVLVNPNNPLGNVYSKEELIYLLNELQDLDYIIIDESFIHFSSINDINSLSMSNFVSKYKNLVIIKSMSKDFGIAGIRCGYAITNHNRVKDLLSKGFLWNSNGLSEYFLSLLADELFVGEYEKCRIRFIHEFEDFYDNLKKIKNINVFPSKANFYLIDLIDIKSNDFMSWMLIEKQIYVRPMNDKIGFGLEKDTYVRIAGKTREENVKICDAISEFFKERIGV